MGPKVGIVYGNPFGPEVHTINLHGSFGSQASALVAFVLRGFFVRIVLLKVLEGDIADNCCLYLNPKSW